MAATRTSVFRFADVEVREREFTVLKAGVARAVEPKAFRVLLVLLKSPQKLVAQEELMKAVWGDAAVTDNSLTRSIALLRKVLGDDAHQPRYIETVTTVGYRFLAPVRVEEEVSAGAEVAPIGAAVIKDRRRGIPGWWVGAAALAVAALAGAGWYLSRPLPPLRIAGYTQVTHDGRAKFLGGTDGSRLYFTFLSSSSIAQVSVAGGQVAPVHVAVTGSFVVVSDVSPDGSDLLVGADNVKSGITGTWVVPVLGSSKRHLADGTWGAFSPDGKSVVYATAGNEIYVVDNDGAGAHKLASLGSEARYGIRWSPDGTLIRFETDGKLWEMSADGTGLHPLLPNWHVPGYQSAGRWSPDGNSYLFQLGAAEFRGGQIWAIDERRRLLGKNPAQPIQLTNGPIQWRNLVTGRDGKTIFVIGETRRGELSRLDEKAGRLEPFLGGISAEFVAFSKDGKSVAYVSFPEGNLWKANSDGSNAVQLTDSPIYAVNPHWSPDGSQILFTDLHNHDHSVSYVVPSDGGGPRRLIANDDGDDADPGWSSDGQKVVFGWSSAGSQKTEDLRILDLASHQVVPVAGSTGLYSPRWSADGRHIAALARVSPYLRLFDVTSRRWSVLPTTRYVGFPCFSSDSKAIYFLGPGPDQGIFRIRVAAGKEEKVADTKEWHLAGFSLESLALDPTDAPLVMRDIGSGDIYALKLEEK